MDKELRSTPPFRQALLRSFRFRLTLLFVVILAVLLIAFSLFIYFRQVQVLRSETANRLIAQMSRLGLFYNSDDGQLFELHEEDDERVVDTAANLPLLQEYDHFAVLGGDSRVLQKSEHFSAQDLDAILQIWLNAEDPSKTIPYTVSYSSEEVLGSDGNANQEYLFVGSSLEYERERYGALILGTPMDQANQLPRLALVLVLVCGLTLLVAFGGGFWLANQAMQPVQMITRTALEIGEHDLNRRLNLERGDELGELASTFDQMLDRLQAAFERQRQFTADASHELRTPLTIIELETNRSLERPRTKMEYERALHTIRSENERMSRMVNELLTLARMDSGRASMHLEKIDTSEIAVEVVERLAPLAAKNQVILQSGALEESIVRADKEYLMHVLVNLVENALLYSTGPSPRVVVETGTETQEEGRRAWIKVVDNGPGISPEDLPHLFDRFYRIDKARTQGEDEDGSATTGTGLGLAIVQSIVQASGGQIDVQSEMGKGTVFTIWMPGV